MGKLGTHKIATPVWPTEMCMHRRGCFCEVASCVVTSWLRFRCWLRLQGRLRIGAYLAVEHDLSWATTSWCEADGSVAHQQCLDALLEIVALEGLDAILQEPVPNFDTSILLWIVDGAGDVLDVATAKKLAKLVGHELSAIVSDQRIGVAIACKKLC